MRQASRPPRLAQLRRRPRGAAVVTALLIVTLAVVVVSGMLWRQQVQIRAIENQRLLAQATWIERAAVDWARLILRDDQRRTNVDELGEPWAVPIAETRLSDFLGAALRTDVAGETSFLSGRILDAQARLNLANLVIWTATGGADGQPGRAASVDPAALAAYRRLLQTVGLNPELAETTARYMLQAAQGGNASGQPAPRPLDSVQGLMALPGYTPEMVAVLEPFVTVLPERTPVNANTAEAEVLAAVINKLPLERARELVRQRDRAHFNNLGNLQTQLAAVAPQADAANLGNLLDVRTHYFLVYGLVRHERATRLQVSLVFRGEPLGTANTTRVVWIQDADRLPDLR
ncbi:type II secretion system minor pseudopilin GspK [Cupriavidus necator]|uniref:Type II secretion system protein K n=1 Tax=Cupriavidus necator (strain ATCC 17699 / DSM 428 / KCTC 22496 / NCIMB 10442 / H16 / Stanier 337) TaxID=381666 RepID=Q0K5X3_CUPNH|nr:type II secretion system minor pseudopilin GspK [Cupriavidus necator]QCC02345.1 general secretion pathway protein GspK [Cupriavidus necator H16]QQB78251.1 type II secretion system minor pseudopilin GspK [Cupriavidus necator]WKA40750.1 type II secretion system minor pseudopilin GspK [Cupriavidus necator]CAJ94598.1 general secretion pathway protein K [Cupriavidus necator H16]